MLYILTKILIQTVVQLVTQTVYNYSACMINQLLYSGQMI